MKDKEKQIKIKRGELVDLLNQEQEELQKAKTIEEMAKEIMKPQDCKGYEDNRGCYFSNGKGCDKCKIERHENAQIMADHLYNLGYRKLPEDSVVLSREEYEKLKAENDKYIKDCINYIATITKLENKVWEVEQQASKETAEKILKWLVGNKHLFNRTHEIGFEKPRTSYLVLNDEIEELAKQYGVEIKE